MKQESVIEVETTVEFVPNKRYRASVWRSENGNIFVRRSRKGAGGTGMVTVLDGKGFCFQHTKDKLKLSITIPKPRDITGLVSQLMTLLNTAVMQAHKNDLLTLIK
ncbi:MAG: hypothetical protein KBT12_02725 [Bacteroidales bacterium]|nr:hypothetical protein [Candidatus Physcousia equi]